LRQLVELEHKQELAEFLAGLNGFSEAGFWVVLLDLVRELEVKVVVPLEVVLAI
jgi:hypothetical protein